MPVIDANRKPFYMNLNLFPMGIIHNIILSFRAIIISMEVIIMTKDELIKIFQEVNRDLLEEHIPEKIGENFRSHCKPDTNAVHEIFFTLFTLTVCVL